MPASCRSWLAAGCLGLAGWLRHGAVALASAAPLLLACFAVAGSISRWRWWRREQLRRAAAAVVVGRICYCADYSGTSPTAAPAATPPSPPAHSGCGPTMRATPLPSPLRWRSWDWTWAKAVLMVQLLPLSPLQMQLSSGRACTATGCCSSAASPLSRQSGRWRSRKRASGPWSRTRCVRVPGCWVTACSCVGRRS
jgi:hypothetical protein